MFRSIILAALVGSAAVLATAEPVEAGRVRVRVGPAGVRVQTYRPRVVARPVYVRPRYVAPRYIAPRYGYRAYGYPTYGYQTYGYPAYGYGAGVYIGGPRVGFGVYGY